MEFLRLLKAGSVSALDVLRICVFSSWEAERISAFVVLRLVSPGIGSWKLISTCSAEVVRSGSCEAGSISATVVLRKGLSQAIEKLDQLLKASETLSGILAGKQLGLILESYLCLKKGP